MIRWASADAFSRFFKLRINNFQYRHALCPTMNVKSGFQTVLKFIGEQNELANFATFVTCLIKKNSDVG